MISTTLGSAHSIQLLFVSFLLISSQKPAMAHKLDPHHIIAILHLAHLKQQDTPPGPLDSTHRTYKYDITNDCDAGIGTSRVFPVLDAIASLSVYKEQHQVVAVALQLDSEKQIVRLTIAENCEVEDQLISHLTNIWGKLQTLSDKYTKHREPDLSGCMSPEIPQEIAVPLKAEIFRELCLFSLNKHMSRVCKWGNEFLLFMRAFNKSRRGVDLDEFEQNLYDVGTALIYLITSLADLDANPEKELTMDWEEMFGESMVVSAGIGAVLANKSGQCCEVLASKLQGIFFCSVLPYNPE